MGIDELKLIMDAVSSISGMGVNVAYAYFVQTLPFAFGAILSVSVIGSYHVLRRKHYKE